MNQSAILDARLASRAIILGDYPAAQQLLRSALRGCNNRRAWSKLMLAIRELNRLSPAA